MPLIIRDTLFPEVKIISGTRFRDERGFFVEKYNEKEYLELGIPRFVQDNMSESSLGVIRGMHWQIDPEAQGKLVTCLSGSILDIILDVRKDSSTFGTSVALDLTSDTDDCVWIPSGFAHGFQALSDSTRVHYKVTNFWSKECERSINPLDIDLKLPWKDLTPIISHKDAEALSISQIFNDTL
jgi:dTDP-4-dehydrorhamnose 3,5-epimerase